ncbi:MAG: sulfur transferase domain-containing protein [Planctomycetota bacterium]|nr:sulfur transferase domain-containing protein [Planctomycetota bacterium]
MRLSASCLGLFLLVLAGCGDSEPVTVVEGPPKPTVEFTGTDRIVIAGQPSEARIAELGKGFDLVLDLNPEAKAPSFDEAAAVKAAELAYEHVPLSKKTVLDKAAREKAYAVLDRLEKENLRAYVHCSTANRAAALWTFYLVDRKGRSAEEAVAEGKRIGLTKLLPDVREALGLEAE